jgi:hypothetical protein
MAQRSLILVCTLLVGLPGGASTAQADPINPGSDLFQTIPEGTFVDLTPQGLGVVPLMGVPFDAQLGNTDTIVRRLTGLPDLPIGGSGPIQIQLTALNLMSVNPVMIGSSSYNLTVQGGTLFGFDEPFGQIIVRRTSNRGGSLSSQLPVRARLKFINVDDPTDMLVLDFNDLLRSRDDDLVCWAFCAAPMYPDDPRFPSGGFFAAVDPENCIPWPLVEEEANGTHTVIPATIGGGGGANPEPASLALVAVAGVVGILAWGRNRFWRVVRDRVVTDPTERQVCLDVQSSPC